MNESNENFNQAMPTAETLAQERVAKIKLDIEHADPLNKRQPYPEVRQPRTIDQKVEDKLEELYQRKDIDAIRSDEVIPNPDPSKTKINS